ncbi:MAG TPA: hypothetical protein VM936_13830, partial [Pyrinomonadaceae bacterium]|nr:hypothetical protein [Pyrinomonadaceae bacterium]
VIKEMIQNETVTLEDGLSFATNPNNLMLALKGMSITDDFQSADEPVAPAVKRPTPAAPAARPFPNAPARTSPASMLDMIE